MNNPVRSRWLIGVLLVATALLGACGSAESRKAAYIEHGKRYLAAGNYDKARVEFGNASQIDPRDAEVHYLLGEVAEKLNDARGAVGQYQAAIDQDPKESAARAALGRLYVFGGLSDKALELVEPGLAAEPNNPQLLTVRGAARAQLGDAKSALQDAQRAVQLAPDDQYAIALLASLYRRQSRYDQAIAVAQTGLQHLPKSVDLRIILSDLELAQNRPADAEAQLKQVIALEPKVIVDRYRLARFYLQQKNVDAAEQTLRAAVSAFPTDTDAKSQLVQFLAAQRGRDRAVAETEQFLAREPDNNALQLALGQLLAQLGQSARAESTFRAVIARVGEKPDGLVARDRLAALLLARNDVSGATALLAQVLNDSPHDSDALMLRGNLSLSGGDISGAITDLRSVLRDQPESVPVMRMLARAYQANGEIEQAEETLRSAVQIAPNDAGGRLDLAQVLIAANKSDQAEALLEQLGKEQPTNVTVQEALYRAQAEQKHYDEARATAQGIERLNPSQALGYYLEGMVDESDNRADAAAKDYERALQLQPNAGEPLTALTRLDLAQTRFAAALARIETVIGRFPMDRVALGLKGDLLLTQRQTDAAIAAYQQAIQVAPTWNKGYAGLASAQVQANHTDDAIHTLQLGIDKTQGDTVLLTVLSDLYQRLGRPDDAIALYRAALTRNPKSVFALNNLAMLLVTYKHDASSLEQAQKFADELSSLSIATVIDTRGWVKYKTGDFHAAESLLQQAVDKSPNLPELRYHLGMAQFRSGEPQAAQQNLESALQSAQQFAGLSDARATLAQLQKSPSAG